MFQFFLNTYAPHDRFERRKWLNCLELSFHLMLYSFPHGNNLGTMSFAWKIPSEVDQTRNQQIINQLDSSQKLYFSRQIRQVFCDKYILLASKTSLKSKAILRNIFRTLVHDESAPIPAKESDVDERLAHFLLNMDDPSIILDLRQLNGKPYSTKFDVFWSELAAYLDEAGVAMHERRHGEAMYIPFAISVSHLRDIIEGHLKEKFPNTEIPVPGLEWIRLQFLPHNPYSVVALRHTGRFDVKYAVQCRQLHKEHPDVKYVAVILRYAKEFALKHRE